jgi:hypothetical protein
MKASLDMMKSIDQLIVWMTELWDMVRAMNSRLHDARDVLKLCVRVVGYRLATDSVR